MLETPERIGARFSILLFLGFMLTPLAGFSTAVLFGVIDLWQLQQVLAGGILPAFSMFLIFFSLFQLQRLITPLTTWALQNPDGGNAPTQLHRQVQRFSRNYWGLMALWGVLLLAGLVAYGQQLTEGPVVPQEILEVCGPQELQEYLVNEVQEVYRLQGVEINDKHIEIIVRQMLRKVRITDPGDTDFLWGEQVERQSFLDVNKSAMQEGKRPVTILFVEFSLASQQFVFRVSVFLRGVVLDGEGAEKIGPLEVGFG